MRVGGLASGMDTDSIVKEMMKIQKMPLDKLTQKKAFTEWQQEALRDANLSMRNLRDSASSLRLQSSFNSYTATSLSSSSVKATATAIAMAGNYTVKVESIASPAKMTSANAITKPATTAADGTVDPARPAKATDKIGVAGTIDVKIGENTKATITITATMSYADVAKEIEKLTIDKVPELRVNFDNTTSRFFMATKGMGSDQNFSLEFSSKALADQVMSNTDPEGGPEITEFTTTNATDGSVKFNGIDIGGLKTNSTTVNGITLNLLEAGPETTITVQSSPEKPLEMIKKFVEDYNKTISDLEKQLVEKRYPDFQPLSAEQKKDMTENEIELWEEKAKSGLLRNDPILKSALQELRRAFMDQVEEIPDGNFKHLSQIGINTGTYTEGGKLFIDEKKLTEELTKNPDEVMQLFVYKDAEGKGVGVGDRVYAKLNEVVTRLSGQAGSTTSGVDNSTLSKKIKQMDEDIKRWQDRMTRLEDRYWKQFTAMEKALSQMNSQSVWMQQNMFGGM